MVQSKAQPLLEVEHGDYPLHRTLANGEVQTIDSTLTNKSPPLSRRLMTLHAATESFARRNERLKRARNIDLSYGTELHHRWESCAHARRHYDESTTRLMQALDAVTKKVSLKRSAPKLKPLYDQVEADQVALKEQSAETKLLEIARSEHTVKVLGLEKQLDLAIHAIRVSLDDDEAVSRSASPGPSISSAISTFTTAPHNHPLLEQFYDKAGDVNVMRERISDYQGSYMDDREQRIFLLDQDRPVDITDADFEAAYSMGLKQLEQDLAEAITEREIAFRDCAEAGIVIPTTIEQELSDAGSDVTDQPYRPPRDPNIGSGAITPMSLTIATGHMQSDGIGESDAQPRMFMPGKSIMDWMEDVELPAASIAERTPQPASSVQSPVVEAQSRPTVNFDGSQSSSIKEWIDTKGMTVSDASESAAIVDEGDRKPTLIVVLDVPIGRNRRPDRYLPERKRSLSEGPDFHGGDEVPSERISVNGIGAADDNGTEASYERHGCWCRMCLPAHYFDPTYDARRYFHVGLIFEANITQLLARPDHASLDLMQHHGKTDVIFGVYVVIEQRDTNFAALTMNAGSVRQTQQPAPALPQTWQAHQQSRLNVKTTRPTLRPLPIGVQPLAQSETDEDSSNLQNTH
nr:hypothetical protein B0A51_03192 [Rachicladosporium sp. CCFEE 5018]